MKKACSERLPCWSRAAGEGQTSARSQEELHRISYMLLNNCRLSINHTLLNKLCVEPGSGAGIVQPFC